MSTYQHTASVADAHAKFTHSIQHNLSTHQLPLACRSIAQGCSEYNITILINQSDSVRALRAVHGCFFLAQLPLAVGIVGPGAIGTTLLSQFHTQAQVAATNSAQCGLLLSTLGYSQEASSQIGRSFGRGSQKSPCSCIRGQCGRVCLQPVIHAVHAVQACGVASCWPSTLCCTVMLPHCSSLKHFLVLPTEIGWSMSSPTWCAAHAGAEGGV